MLVHSIATLHPTRDWVTQQVRNALMYMELDAQPVGIVLDRDCLFTHLVKTSLPSMGIQPCLIDYQAPWQNAVVERFHFTLSHELLNSVQPRDLYHLNRLLGQFKTTTIMLGLI